jgi:hypothetical protein
MRFRWIVLLLSLCLAAGARADGPGDNLPDNVRPIPQPGVAVPAADRAELETGIAALSKEIDGLREALAKKPALLDLLPDVQIYYNAARYALTYNEFFNPREIEVAKQLLQQGMERAQALREGHAPWTTATGLVARGYVSRIDGSVQPYGLVVPATYHPDSPYKHRLDIWFHGRGETLSEVNFINERQHSYGEFAPADTFVLHPYGRFCNANRFAGEVDTLEAMEHVKSHYAIDPDRIAVRGFSMGGAACWQFGTHYAGDWAAVAPGAGFSETADFLKVFQNEKVKPTWYEQKLWHLYDSIDYAVNLFNVPLVAYSGELDGQKQAADFMSAALAKEGITMTHIIGPKAHHFYEAGAKREVARRIDSIMAYPRETIPAHVRFTTWTLRYNRMLWVTVDGLDHHWERARVDAEIVDPSTVKVKTQNVDALSLLMPSGRCPLDNTHAPKVVINGQSVSAPAPESDRSWTAHFRLSGGRWAVATSEEDSTLRKRHGLQGPIDDAFFDSFIMVTPSGTPMNPTVGAWAAGEQEHAITHWRRQFRGEARVKRDTEITDADIADSNLVLWGDPSSNAVLKRIADKLPLRWDSAGLHVGSQTYAANRYVPALIYPNPLNPKRYVVLNSGFTYREYDYLNNARQTPKLPDYAVIDVSVKPNSRTPGGIADAGFFDETWTLTPNSDKPARTARVTK